MAKGASSSVLIFLRSGIIVWCLGQSGSLCVVCVRDRVADHCRDPADVLPITGPLGPVNFQTQTCINDYNDLIGREGSPPDPFPPPLAHCKPEIRSLTGPFFFLFQMGLAMLSDFRRLAFRPKSVSERSASLSIRPSSKSGRIKNINLFQYVVEIELRRS